MKTRTPKKLATIGALLIAISGTVNILLGLRIGALWYDVYPGGRMGHVGVIAGLVAIVIAFVILCLVIPFYKRTTRGFIMLAGILTIVLGHIGAIAGALYIGTAGMVFCYAAGIWLLVLAFKKPKEEPDCSAD